MNTVLQVKGKRKSRKSNPRIINNPRASFFISEPSARGVVQHLGRPSVKSIGNGIEVSNVEPYVQIDTPAAGAYAFGLNPVIPDFSSISNSWIGGLARSYGQFKWLNLDFIYVPFCPTSTPGRVGFAFQYDARDAVPTTANTVDIAQGSVVSPIWGGADGGLSLRSTTLVPGTVCARPDLKRFAKPFYPYVTITNYNAATSADRNIFCPVSLISYAVGGVTAVTAAGQIYIKYTIELSEPIIVPSNA